MNHFTSQPYLLIAPRKKPFEDIMEKKKLLVTIIFSFSKILKRFSVLSLSNFNFTISFILSFGIVFKLDKSKSLEIGNELTLYLMCQFLALQIQQQIKI